MDQTLALGESLGRSLVGGLVVGLVGPLGSGKTHFVKGVARGNGLADVRGVTSPTFTLVHEYEGLITLFHIDAYRLAGASELESLGFDEFSRADAAVVVEWADRVFAAMQGDALWITLAPTGQASRSIECEARGEAPQRCLARWLADLR